jgi:hypothetical protein
LTRHEFGRNSGVGRSTSGTAQPHRWEGEEQNKEIILTLLWLGSNRFLSKLKFPTVAHDDWDFWAVLLVCWNVYDFWDDVVIPADHATEHHVFACVKKGSVYGMNQRVGGAEFWRTARFAKEEENM